jgi:hypothetical protein
VNRVSAFGVVHTTITKSRLPGGDYKPANQLTPDERTMVRRSALRPRMERLSGRDPKKRPNAKRGLGETYQAHGYSTRGKGFDEPVSAHTEQKMRREFDPAGHVQSEKHPKIQYGPSTTPKLRRRMDRKINPDIAGKLKHPVVIQAMSCWAAHSMLPADARATKPSPGWACPRPPGRSTMNWCTRRSNGHPGSRDSSGLPEWARRRGRMRCRVRITTGRTA